MFRTKKLRPYRNPQHVLSLSSEAEETNGLGHFRHFRAVASQTKLVGYWDRIGISKELMVGQKCETPQPTPFHQSQIVPFYWH
jgi:hypothetical protein